MLPNWLLNRQRSEANVPRRRHQLPAPVLSCLQPLFRYSQWRDAWILRGVGERYGPVLTISGGQAPATFGVTRPAQRRRPDTLPQLPLILMLGGILVAAGLGFTLASATTGRESPPALGQHASVGLLQVSFPSGWRRQAPPATPRLGLSDEIALAPTAPAAGSLIIGRSAGPSQGLLPKSLLAALPRAPTPQIVTLGPTSFYRYPKLSPRGARVSESVYALPTGVGTILGVCLMPQPSPSFTSSCERILQTVRLSSGKLPPGPSPSYATGLSTAVSKLNVARARAGVQLSRARDAHGQATGAMALSAVHEQAASALARLNAGSASAANSALVSALRKVGDAYLTLARAAVRTDSRAYSAAGASVMRAIHALNSDFAQLSRLGYPVS